MNWYLEVLKNYAKFTGRARRKEYWMFVLFNTIILIVLSIIDAMIGTSIGVLSSIYMLAVLVPSIAVGVRRLHDIDKSGWWMLIAAVPLLGLVLFVFLMFDSKPGPNRFGPNPKGV